MPSIRIFRNPDMDPLVKEAKEALSIELQQAVAAIFDRDIGDIEVLFIPVEYARNCLDLSADIIFSDTKFEFCPTEEEQIRVAEEVRLLLMRTNLLPVGYKTVGSWSRPQTKARFRWGTR
jgi:hypothetical protein